MDCEDDKEGEEEGATEKDDELVMGDEREVDELEV